MSAPNRNRGMVACKAPLSPASYAAQASRYARMRRCSGRLETPFVAAAGIDHASARQGRAALRRRCRRPVAASADGRTVGGRILAVASPATDRYYATTLFDVGAVYAGAAPRGLGPFCPHWQKRVAGRPD